MHGVEITELQQKSRQSLVGTMYTTARRRRIRVPRSDYMLITVQKCTYCTTPLMLRQRHTPSQRAAKKTYFLHNGAVVCKRTRDDRFTEALQRH